MNHLRVTPHIALGGTLVIQSVSYFNDRDEVSGMKVRAQNRSKTTRACRTIDTEKLDLAGFTLAIRQKSRARKHRVVISASKSPVYTSH